MKDTVEKVATLARLALDEKDVKKYSGHFTDILKYFETLNELDTKGVEPMSHAVETASVLRADVAVKCEVASDIVALAPEKDGKFVEVPKVI